MSRDLLAWRRAVADLYAVVRASSPEAGHAAWRRGRDDLFRTSPESPLPADDPRRTQGLPVTPYDPAWRCEVPLEPAAPLARTLDGGVPMTRIGVLRTPWGPLDAWWLDEYSGGLFVPVKDRTAGSTSYGAGRYLLDTAKGADLGGDVVVDLNFLYHPSCAYDPAWSCPLAPEGNVLDVRVTAGEVLGPSGGFVGGLGKGGHMAVVRTSSLTERFLESRALTEALAAPLSPEDQTAQSMPDASPTKWHRAHTTWFYEEFVLGERDYEPFDASFRFLFNSYYEAVGPRHPRAERGLVTRPGVEEVGRYRRHVDAAVEALLAMDPADAVLTLVELGINHEQQHQELLVMDVKHLLSRHAFGPAVISRPDDEPATSAPLSFRGVAGGIHEVGATGGFSFDNEGPRHQVLLRDFEIANRAVTVEDWLAFMADGGYKRPDLWLSDGWYAVQREGWRSPDYWWDVDGTWMTFTTAGVRPLVLGEPVVHVSFFEADAYARWAGGRLPTEFEWEIAAADVEPRRGQLLDLDRLHPGLAGDHMVGDVWEWTASQYLPYPGFTPAAGAVGEYNGKFMNDQHVLRGASCATPAGHERTSYRNFFPAASRWAFSGLRLAR